LQHTVKLKIKANPGFIASEVMKRGLYDAYIDALLDLADEFQQNSPVGATKELKGSWDVTRPKKQAVTFQIDASITNNSERAGNRIAGRSPGAAPPIEPLTDWVIAKGIATEPKRARSISFAIAKKIAREGTERHQEGNNWVGISSDGQRISGGRLEIAEREIAAIISNYFK
jgi:hypothetical protein